MTYIEDEVEEMTSIFSDARASDKQLSSIFSTGQRGAVNVSNFLGSTEGDGYVVSLFS